MLSSYFIELRTNADYTKDTYDAAAGRLAGLLVNVLSSTTNINDLTHDSPRETCASEIEVCLEPSGLDRELVGRAVVDIHAPEKVGFDKSLLSKLIKADSTAAEWPKLKIMKKAVPAALP